MSLNLGARASAIGLLKSLEKTLKDSIYSLAKVAETSNAKLIQLIVFRNQRLSQKIRQK